MPNWHANLRTTRGGAGCGQRVFYGVAHGLVDFAAVAEAHFDLGGVYVHIHPCRVHGDIQGVHRLAVAVQHVFIGAAGGVGEDFVSHKAAVHVAELLVTA